MHPRTGRFLQARQRGAKKLVFYATNFGVNEQFEATETHETNPRGRYRVNDLLVSCLIRPRRFPGMALNVKMHTLRAEARELTPWQKNLVSGGMTMAGGWRAPFSATFGGARGSVASSSVVSSATATPAASPLPAPPTSRPGSVSHARARPPAGPSSSWTTISGAAGPGSVAATPSITPTVSPLSYARRQSWRAALGTLETGPLVSGVGAPPVSYTTSRASTPGGYYGDTGASMSMGRSAPVSP